MSVAIISTLSMSPVLAQQTNFDSLKLSAGFSPDKAVLTGYTNGSVSLASLSNTDNNQCLGYASNIPDHILELDKDFPSLLLKATSSKREITLLIKTPDDQVICADSTSKKEVMIKTQHWKKGKYRIWVGSLDEGQNSKYTLFVQQ
ncbi:MAG TPA: hypothetical protein V6C58_27460 [Allocoleopsis sp.]